MLIDYYKLTKEKMPSVSHFFGAVHIAENSSVSRIVWVPSEDEIGGIKPRSKQGNPRAILNRSAGADLYIFGVAAPNEKEANHEVTEELLHEVLSVLHENFHGNLDFDRVRWGIRQQDQWLTFGGACILPVYFDVSVCEKPLRTATVKLVEHDFDME